MNEMMDMRNNRYYDDGMYGYREDYREDYRRDYRDRDYDRRGGRLNNRNYRNYRNYREQDYHEELEIAMEEIREQSRNLEDVAEMAHNMQDKNVIMKVAQKEKDNYNYLKQIVNKPM